MFQKKVRAEVDERDIAYVELGQRANMISEFDKTNGGRAKSAGQKRRPSLCTPSHWQRRTH
jgi:hypothetical protein